MSILYTSVDVQLAVKMGFGAQDSGLDLEIMSVSPKKSPHQFTYWERPADPLISFRTESVLQTPSAISLRSVLMLLPLQLGACSY